MADLGGAPPKKAQASGGKTDRRIGIFSIRSEPGWTCRKREELVLVVDPIGLEDWKARGVAWQSVDAWYRQELQTTAERIRSYERATYDADTGEPTYERWVQMV